MRFSRLRQDHDVRSMLRSFSPDREPDASGGSRDHDSSSFQALCPCGLSQGPVSLEDGLRSEIAFPGFQSSQTRDRESSTDSAIKGF